MARRRGRQKRVDKSFVELFERKKKEKNIASFPEFTRRVTDDLLELEEIKKKMIEKEKDERDNDFRFRI